MPSTYEPIATTTLATATTSVTLSSIPSTYTDLVVIINGKTSYSASAGAFYVFFNSDNVNAHYSITRLFGDGSSATSDRFSASYAGWLSTEMGTNIVQINNYANTTTYKTYLTKSASSGSYPISGTTVGLWRGSTGSATQAINSVSIEDASGNLQTGTMITLYGIKSA